MSRAPFVFVGIAGLCIAAAFLAPTVDAQSAIAIDEHGFVDSEARCEAPWQPVAFGRTQFALVAICTRDGSHQYRGVRMSDGLTLTAAAVEKDDGVFTVEHDGATYTFSAKELVVASGDRVLITEPMVAYVEPRVAADG
ncbi:MULTISPECIES: hypothetical protein [unclassified Mycobacterium]|uniref:hypothetical protein n=1 Tax=unclassified Mycobacterium TaxID=2642494 RepID=UPI0012E36D72|nr:MULTISPECIES: hypothetical protein [unclassified Mycobacterium]